VGKKEYAYKVKSSPHHILPIFWDFRENKLPSGSCVGIESLFSSSMTMTSSAQCRLLLLNARIVGTGLDWCRNKVQLHYQEQHTQKRFSTRPSLFFFDWRIFRCTFISSFGSIRQRLQRLPLRSSGGLLSFLGWVLFGWQWVNCFLQLFAPQ
jgi:hypothetical protein